VTFSFSSIRDSAIRFRLTAPLGEAFAFILDLRKPKQRVRFRVDTLIKLDNFYLFWKPLPG
jgi:hypothetical protein